MNRIFTVIFLLSITSSFGQIGGSWLQKAGISTSNRESAVGFSIGGKGYIGLGIVGGGVNGALWEYNRTSDSWTQKAGMSGGGRVNPVAFVIGNYAYVGTGENNLFNLDPPTCYSCSLNGFNGATYDVPGIFGYLSATYHVQ